MKKENCFIKFINTTDDVYKLSTRFKPKHAPLSKYEQSNSNKLPCHEARKLKLKNEINTQSLEAKTKNKVEALCMELNDIFSLKNDVLTHNNYYEQNIQLSEQKPVYIKNYRTPEIQKTEINAQVNKMLNDKIIQHSISPFNSPILLVPKKSSTFYDRCT